MKKINLLKAVSTIGSMWSPRVVGQVGDVYVKIVRMRGDFIWHKHPNEEEMFIILKGRLCIKFRDQEIWLEAGEALTIPKGVEHCTQAPDEVYTMLVEPISTVNTGDTIDPRFESKPVFLE